MTRIGVGLTVLLTALLAGPAAGQTQKIQDEIDLKLAKARAANRTEEDVEIFRRLLNRVLIANLDPATRAAGNCPAFQGGLGNLDPFGPGPGMGRSVMAVPGAPGGASSDPDQEGGTDNALVQVMGDSVRPWFGVHSRTGKLQMPNLAEGVHLPGRGVVFTATMPLPSRSPVGTWEKPAEPALSPWERERRALRGEGSEKPAKGASTPALSEAILKLLAENGTHFSGLGPDEPVTVAVVFRPGKVFANELCMACHQTNAKAAWMDWLGEGNPGTPGGPIGSGVPARPRPVGPGSASQSSESVADLFRNGLSLGELHLKQGKPREAVKVYRDLVGRCVETLEALGKLPSEQSAAEIAYVVRVAMEVYAKLAQAQVELSDTEAALKTLKEWQAFGDKYVQAPAGPGTGTITKPKPTPSPVPARLIVSAPKQLLDQVGSGRLKFDDFCKGATVKYTGAEK